MMSSILFSWLGAAALAPFVTILSAWTIIVFNSYRPKWRLVDVFLFSVTAYEMVYSFFCFGFAVLNIIQPALNIPCEAIVWGLTAGRTFHLAAITSLLFDRAMASRKPYSYRSRKSQVRYHMVVLATIALFVGLTALFARSSTNFPGVCTVRPLSWDFKFSLILAIAYVVLLLTGLLCSVVWLFSPIPQYSRNFSPSSSWKSGISSSSSNSSEFLKQENSSECWQCDWKPIVLGCWIPYCLNHGPFAAMSFLGMLQPKLWTPWMDNATIWMNLAQGILVPLGLLIVDLPYRRAVKNMLSSPGKLYNDLSAAHGGFRTPFRDVKPRIPSVLMLPSHRFLPFSGSFHMPHRLRWTPNTLPSLQSFTQDKCQSPPVPSSSYRSTEDSKDATSGCITPSDVYGQDLYSTLGSSCYTMLSFKPRSPEPVSINSSESEDQMTDGESITTDALDDFEFLGAKVSEAASPPALPRAKSGKSAKDMSQAAKKVLNNRIIHNEKKPTTKDLSEYLSEEETGQQPRPPLPPLGKKPPEEHDLPRRTAEEANSLELNIKDAGSPSRANKSGVRMVPSEKQTRSAKTSRIDGATGVASCQEDLDSLDGSSPTDTGSDSKGGETSRKELYLQVKSGALDQFVGLRFPQRLWRKDVIYSEYL